MDDGRRWIVAVIAALALVTLILFARGTPDHGDTEATPVPIGFLVPA
jgi:hypothetical protein